MDISPLHLIDMGYVATLAHKKQWNFWVFVHKKRWNLVGVGVVARGLL